MRLPTAPLEDAYETRRNREEIKLRNDRDEANKLRLLVAHLVDTVDALEGEPIQYTLGKNLALANDAVRVALGNPSRLADQQKPDGAD